MVSSDVHGEPGLRFRRSHSSRQRGPVKDNANGGGGTEAEDRMRTTSHFSTFGHIPDPLRAFVLRRGAELAGLGLVGAAADRLGSFVLVRRGPEL